MVRSAGPIVPISLSTTAVLEYSVTIAHTNNTGLMCPSNQTEEVQLGTSAVAVTWEIGLLGPRLAVTRRLGLTSLWVQQKYFVYYFNGNFELCKLFVTVLEVGPLPSSVIDVCPVDIATTIELGTPNVQVSWIEPVPTGVPVAVTLMENTHSPGDLFMLGMTTVSYLFQDAQGNSLACEFVVTVVAGKKYNMVT
ncbi:putative hyalin-like [Apostichopus japonicus]|uniref:Putative hyalin-like n=1 Tax=Stichopus japonicus TaxID=307972 RepID=A0A2G8LJA2_STIJA|nr:putative hyalin-like [Apostichopus japonicus]